MPFITDLAILSVSIFFFLIGGAYVNIFCNTVCIDICEEF